MSILLKLKAQCAAQKAAVVALPTVAEFVRTMPRHSHAWTVESVICRALTYYPNITRRTWETRVEWDASLKNSAGQFFSSKTLISLHPGLKLADDCHFVQTFLHELAHGMQWYAHRECNHKDTWREMMHLLACKPERLHNIDECKDYEFVARFDKLMKGSQS